jgi:glycosyltransferase involved in cell wall biosynthesis
MSAPLISIIVATRNAAGRLVRCLDSIRAQRFRDFELLVMDGGSIDGTVGILEASGDVVTAWRSEPDRGIYNAWNKALGIARGEWICFLGADDWLWDENALENLAPYLREAAADYRIVYSRLRLVHADGTVISESGAPWEELKRAFRSYRCLPHPGLMHRRSLFALRGGFDEGFRIAGDYELLLRELKEGDALFVPVLTVGMEFGGLTTQPDQWRRQLREVRWALARHGLRPPRLRWALWSAMAALYAAVHRVLGDRNARRLTDLYRLLTFRGPRYSR